MAYGLLLYKEITAPEGTHRLEVYKDGYTGTAIEIDGLVRDSIVLSKNAGEVSDAITTSVLSFSLYDTGQIDYLQLFTPNATLFKVVLKLGGVARWTGFLTPDSYSENLSYRDAITLTARDNLGRLNDYDFSLARGQMLSVRSIINSGLSVAGVAMGVTFTTAKVASSPATILAVDGLVNTSLLQGKTWHAALTLLLEGLGMTLSWNEGNTFEVRDISQAPSSTQAAFFINKSGFRQKRPAWKNLTVSQDYGIRDNFYEGQLSEEQCGTGATFDIPSTSKWNVGGSYTMLNPYKGAGIPYETLFLPIQGGDTMTNRISYSFVAPGGDVPIEIKFTCNNTAWAWMPSSEGAGFEGIVDRTILYTKRYLNEYLPTPYKIRFRCNIFATVGTTTYILRDEWQVYDPSTIEDPYLYFVMPAALNERQQVSAVNAENEVSIYLSRIPGPGVVSIVFYQPNVEKADYVEMGDIATYALAKLVSSYTTAYAKVTNVTMVVQNGIEGRTDMVTVNADHNVQSSADFGVGQVPSGKGNVLLYLGGLFYTDSYNTPLASFSRNGSGISYDLLELVARERISFNNDNYDQLSGTMKASAAFSFGKGILFEGTAYRLISASLNILSNTLQVQAMQTEPQFATADYVIQEVDGESGYSTRGSYTGGGIPQGPQASVDWFVSETYEVDGETRRRLKLNPAYTGMYAEGWITAGGFGSDSGGTGGSLATLADVTLTDLAAGDILHYDATTSHWVNGPLAVALASLTDVAIGTPSNGQALVYDSTLGKWKPGNVSGGSVDVISSDATIGTSLTTLGTINGTPIKAKIASYLLSADFTAANIVSTLGNTPVNRATGDESGNNIKSTYGAGLYVTGGNLYLKSKSNELLTAYVDGSDIVSVIGNNAVNRATADANGNNIASTYLTSSALSGYATQTWVEQQDYLTSSDLSGYATQSWVEGKGYVTSSALSGYMLSSDFTAANIVSTLGATAVNRATGDESGNNIKSTYGAGLYVTGGNLYLKSKSNELLTAYVDGSDLVAIIGTNAVARATADASGNTITTSYLRKDTDDTMSANLTVGTSGSRKTLTLYGSTSTALTIHGGSYYTDIYRNSSGLNIDSAVAVSGNITATGNIVAGTTSDRRLKQHIETIADATDVLTSLRPVTFEWNDKAGELGGLTGVSSGFVADEYNSIIPNATRKIWGEYDAIDYIRVIPYLVAGWQRQQEEIKELKRRLSDVI